MKRKTYLSEVYEYLIENLSEHITIEKAAAYAYVSKTKLKNDFRREYGISFYSYFRCKKMEKAAEMLVNTDKKIIDIAEYLGYENSSKFAKAFRDVTGFSPSEYRRNMKKPVLFDNELANANKIGERRIV